MSEFDTEKWGEIDEKLPGWLSEEEARFLVENVVGKFYLEIGVAYGKSLRVVRFNTDPDKLEVHGIDKIDHGVQVPDTVVHYGDSLILAREEEWCKREISTLFIDGDHTYEGCLNDFANWYPRVISGGKIIFHDYGRRTKEHEGVTKAVDAVKPMLADFKSVPCIACGTKQ
jgi:hypothetical protein